MRIRWLLGNVVQPGQSRQRGAGGAARPVLGVRRRRARLRAGEDGTLGPRAEGESGRSGLGEAESGIRVQAIEGRAGARGFGASHLRAGT